LDKYQLISSTQHGFRRDGFCLSNLIRFLDKASGFLDADECTDVIYLDFSKAFDKVPHCRLIEKLDKRGIGGNVKSWIESWQNGRRQRVCVNGNHSAWRNVTSGVPQGSVFGPVLYLIYINDLESNILSSVFKFADDTKLLGKVNNTDDRDLLQLDMKQKMDWSNLWHCHLMPLNAVLCIWAGIITGTRTQ